jgi:hypothetical protein
VQRQTSIDREEYQRTSGETKERAKRFLPILETSERLGATWKEMQRRYENAYGVQLHHGQISGLLTNLHKAGKVFICSKMKRENCFVYLHCKYKDWFAEEDRFDTPVQTKAGIRRACLEEVVAQLRVLSEKEERLSYSEFSQTVVDILETFDYKTSPYA